MAGFFKSLIQRFTKPDIDWDDLEASLIAGDLGPRLSLQIVADLKSRQRTLHGADIVQVAREHVRKILPQSVPPLDPLPGRPKVILMVGVNGTGKTTSTAKLAHVLHGRGHKVVLAAADTFRAAAVEQLTVWAERLKIPLVKGPPNCDPAAVCFDGYEMALKTQADFLICDTAGRLHTKHNLMEELKKIHRILGRKDSESPHEVLLVVDATTGSNALQQAREFHKAIPLTGVIVTKLDGSGKGGVLVNIQQELGVPTRFIGLGERVEDFQPFDSQRYVEELL
ncbi:MAG: signal recognition particle-docking protein FtsY [Prosthecobacter sp.]|jgi:fused signal recognition particle receptor|uniref:signal recognition particle-docking protein FtsY n=1 Tax=Prosthecobacter sp. TaxID=1965333 RepID=UPI001A024548|nr:signal recognition particle-docking protein FtsY [Prosthecobacter sp.]MBE2285551.1 signal recognition particle-docking protein FtsY [Prosthecobacter sp.]